MGEYKVYIYGYFYIALSKMFTVESIATDEGIYSVTRSDGVRLYVHKEQRLIGPFSRIAKILRISSNGEGYKRIKAITKAKPYITNISNISLYPVDSYIGYINKHTKKSQHEKRRVINTINEYLQAIDNIIVHTKSIEDTVSTDDLRYISLEQRIAKLEHIISRILETQPNIAIDESVKVIDSSTITDYNILITVDNKADGKTRLNIEHILSDEYKPVENALMDKAFYISLNQLHELKQNMLIKSDGNLIEIGDDYAIVHDVDDFIDTFKHKLRKIQKNNKKADDTSTCSVITN